MASTESFPSEAEEEISSLMAIYEEITLDHRGWYTIKLPNDVDFSFQYTPLYPNELPAMKFSMNALEEKMMINFIVENLFTPGCRCMFEILNWLFVDFQEFFEYSPRENAQVHPLFSKPHNQQQ